MKKVIPEKSVLIPDKAQRVFEGKIFNVYQWEQELFDGSTDTFEMLKRTDTVAVICIVDDKILVIDDEQPNRGVRKTFPGGRVDDTDESIEDAANREVHEETGYNFKQWRLLKVSQPQMKIEWFVYVLLAWDAGSKDEPHVDPGEKITVNALTFDAVQTLIEDGLIYTPDSAELFEEAGSLEGLLALAEYNGRVVDR